MFISRVMRGGESYYLSSIAGATPEDGETGRGLEGDPHGIWEGTGANELGLRGIAQGADLIQIMQGCDPRDGNMLRSSHATKVAAWDLTFSSPKALSIVWALGSSEVAAHVENAHHNAVMAAAGYAQRHAIKSIRKIAGEASLVDTRGAVACSFGHSLSRASQPHLHTHLLVANLVQGDDDKWTALDSRRLFFHAGAMGQVYQSHMRYEIRKHLECNFVRSPGGFYVLEGLPERLARSFSARRIEIEQQLLAWKQDGPSASRTAALMTRKEKAHHWDKWELRKSWSEQANAIAPQWSLPAVRHQALEVAQTPEVLRAVEGAASGSGFFRRNDLVVSFASQAKDGISAPSLEAVVNETLRSAMVRVVSPSGSIERVWACPSAIRAARAVSNFAHFRDEAALQRNSTVQSAELKTIPVQSSPVPSGVAARSSPVHASAVRDEVGGPALLNGQDEVVLRRLISDERPVSVLRTAGSMFQAIEVLEAARLEWEGSGLKIAAIAGDGRTAKQLETWTGIETTTSFERSIDCDIRIVFGLAAIPIPMWAELPRGLQNRGPERFGRLLVVDGAPSTSPMSTFLNHLDERHVHGSDERLQLLPRSPWVAQINAAVGFGDAETTMRQGEILGSLKGSVDLGNSRVHFLGTSAELLKVVSARMSPDIVRALQAQRPENALGNRPEAASTCLAGSLVEVQKCNAEIRAELIRREILKGGTVLGGVPFAVGDLVRASRPDMRSGLGAVSAVVEIAESSITVEVPDVGRNILRTSDAVRQQLGHAYAMTESQSLRAGALPIAAVGEAPYANSSQKTIDTRLDKTVPDRYLVATHSIATSLFSIAWARTQGLAPPEHAVREVLGRSLEVARPGETAQLVREAGAVTSERSDRNQIAGALWMKEGVAASQISITSDSLQSHPADPRLLRAAFKDRHRIRTQQVQQRQSKAQEREIGF